MKIPTTTSITACPHCGSYHIIKRIFYYYCSKCKNTFEQPEIQLFSGPVIDEKYKVKQREKNIKAGLKLLWEYKKQVIPPTQVIPHIQVAKSHEDVLKNINQKLDQQQKHELTDEQRECFAQLVAFNTLIKNISTSLKDDLQLASPIPPEPKPRQATNYVPICPTCGSTQLNPPRGDRWEWYCPKCMKMFDKPETREKQPVKSDRLEIEIEKRAILRDIKVGLRLLWKQQEVVKPRKPVKSNKIPRVKIPEIQMPEQLFEVVDKKPKPKSRKAQVPRSEPIISLDPAEQRRIEVLRDIKVACKRTKGQVRALQPVFMAKKAK